MSWHKSCTESLSAMTERGWRKLNFWPNSIFCCLSIFSTVSLSLSMCLSVNWLTAAQALATFPWRWCCSTWNSRQRYACTQCSEPASGTATWLAGPSASLSAGATCTTSSCWMWTWRKTCNTTSRGKERRPALAQQLPSSLGVLTFDLLCAGTVARSWTSTWGWAAAGCLFVASTTSALWRNTFQLVGTKISSSDPNTWLVWDLNSTHRH